jgi:hypothetical protein
MRPIVLFFMLKSGYESLGCVEPVFLMFTAGETKIYSEEFADRIEDPRCGVKIFL